MIKIAGPRTGRQYHISRPSTSRFGQPSILRSRLQPGVSQASLAIRPVSSVGSTAYTQSRRGQSAILRGSLRPGTTSASLSIQPYGRSGHFSTSHSRRGQPSLLRSSLRPGTTSANLSIQPAGRSIFQRRLFSPRLQTRLTYRALVRKLTAGP